MSGAPDPLTGKQRQVERTVVAKTKREATRLLDDLRLEVRGSLPPASDLTVRAVVDEYVRHARARGRAPRTIDAAERSLETVIGPALGDVKVGDLGTHHIDELYRKLSTGEGRRPMRPASVRRHHAVLSAALAQAVRWKWIPENPAANASLPPLERPEIIVPTATEVARLLRLADAQGDVWGVLVRLAILTGARRGELAGLQWHDLEGDVLRIRRSVYRIAGRDGVKGTKGGRERRLAVEPGLALVLEDWRSRVDERAAAVGVSIAPNAYIASSWPDCSRPVNVDTLTSTVGRLCAAAGMPHVHLHSLRHLAATELLAAGVSPADAAALLGHADGGKLALQVYAHATDDRQRAAAAVLGAQMPGRIPT